MPNSFPLIGYSGCAVGGVCAPDGMELREIFTALHRMEHRGSSLPEADGRLSGDGAGILMRMPRVVNRWLGQLLPDWPLDSPPWERIGVGVFFLPVAGEAAAALERQAEEILRAGGLSPLVWRTVPTNPQGAALGMRAQESLPTIRQLFIAPGEAMDGEVLEQQLHRARKQMELAALDRPLHIASLSCRLLNYKGMLTSDQLRTFFPDLTATGQETLVSEIILFHRRFSTNTFPNWFLAQPFHVLAHNGEINSISANRRAVHNIEKQDPLYPELAHILDACSSDSGDLDQMVEFFLRDNRQLAITLMSMIPPAWRTEGHTLPVPVIRFYQYCLFHLMSLGQWEGPAGIVATDGRTLVVKEDRIGLRPLRWQRLDGGQVLVSSEVGAFPVDPQHILESGKLGSGQVMQVALSGRMLFDTNILLEHMHDHPNLQAHLDYLHIATVDMPATGLSAALEVAAERRDALVHGFFRRHLAMVESLLTNSMEPTVAMGKGVPAAALSSEPAAIYDFFLQSFAQITNPPIDFIREKKFFDLHIFLGDRSSNDGLQLASPCLNSDTLAWLAALPETLSLSATFVAGPTPEELAVGCRQALAELLRRIIAGISEGKNMIILHDGGDRRGEEIVIPGPILAATLHRGLCPAGMRHRCALILDLGEMRVPHDLAVNLAYGADAVHPAQIWRVGRRLARKKVARQPDSTPGLWLANLANGLDKALLKIMSKMGITTAAGYHNSQLFTPFGLGEEIQELLGRADPYGVGGRSLGEILSFQVKRRQGRGGRATLEWEESKKWIQQAALTADPASLQSLESKRSRPYKPLHFLSFNPPPSPQRVSFQESGEEVVARYLVGAAMSHGALKDTAHRAIAAAFNSLGGRSNCGEGGESADRDNTRFASKIRQVASGRFGVDARYLVHAEELQIKISQGAKPGEGGQLMGVKVDEVIARNRHCAPGTTLISPQTHQDIYSIEDLQQLIHDLRAVNPQGKISVKIAASPGVGVIAVGVAKMFAHIIEIDGMGGGTAATPESSREHTAHYAEFGLAEVHQTLVDQGMRGSVTLRVASGIRSGADVVKYLLLGADEVSLGSALMVAQGCIACAQCHTGRCPTAITGTPAKGDPCPYPLEEQIQRVAHYLLALARDACRIAAALGVSRLAELTGQTHLLRLPTLPHLNLEFLLRCEKKNLPAPAVPVPMPPHSMAKNRQLWEMAAETVDRGESARLSMALDNSDLSFGAMLAGAMAKRWPAGYPDGAVIQVAAVGYGGQKLGFAGVGGLEIWLDGPTNDTPGAVMSGGLLVIAPAGVNAESHVNAGNAVGYGATGGEIDVLGRVGERCAIRNSGSSIVVGGANDFLAEYQTGGETICLSPPGREVGAGMTGGVIFIHNPGGGDLTSRLSPNVTVTVPTPSQWQGLQTRLERYTQRTGSRQGSNMLAAWESTKQDVTMLTPTGTASVRGSRGDHPPRPGLGQNPGRGPGMETLKTPDTK